MKRQAKETQLATARPVAGTTIVVNQPTAIPTFDGTVEKFAEFWQIFIHIVDSDPHLAKIEKLSRLMAALKGDARATLASILVHEDNYELAKTKLLAEYGSDAKVIILLHKALEKKTANSGRPKDQKTLYFEIEGVTTQLLARSQQLDSPLITVQILNKFSNDVRRRINGKTVDDPLLLSNFDKFMKALKRVIEILIAESGDKDHPKGVNSSNVNAFQTGNRAQNNPKNQHQQDKKDAYPITNPPKGGVCAFCKSPEHFSWYCSNVKDIKRRREILIAEARCFRCFKIGHNSNNCTRGPCHTCQGDHNAVVCYKNAASKGNPSKEANSNSQQSANKPRAKGNWNGKFKGKPKGKAQTHHVKAEEPDHEPVQEAQTNHVARLNMKAILPVAQADVRKTANSKQSISVTVLLDTASDTTFISNGLAKKMGLHQGESKRMSMRVFGQERKYIDYPVFKFVLTHGEGKEMGKIPIEAFGSDTLTGDLSVGVLTREDMNFIRKRHVKLALPRSSGDSCTPDILLGQDQLDEVWDETRRPLRLPSGSWLIPTIFGYVRMGKAPVRRSRGTSESTVSQILVNAIQLAEEETEESAVTQIIVNTVESMRIPDYTPSFEEFTGTSKEEKEAMEKADFGRYLCVLSSSTLDSHTRTSPIQQVHRSAQTVGQDEWPQEGYKPSAADGCCFPGSN
ncbi:hypothetical protein WR25_20718 [Diploscapter pachys]|uniref:CCHC-type domain-containing protein n=1 Tax=Diploscapter pachys TaxID=2018661 RepID=A0A2A2JBG9_9BILA|nr:hypothetical protein WR25_20718 [Diploscapter pachys]